MTSVFFVLLCLASLNDTPGPQRSKQNVGGAEAAVDLDRDGLSDLLEQDLLQRFQPSFLVSARDCAGMPAEFLPGSSDPRVAAENGTIYGQVFPYTGPKKDGLFVEVHYYHLWSRDCGRPAHPLDAEHVSALLWTQSAGGAASTWKAMYWFAAAHQNTLCDASSVARAKDLGAEAQGPEILISRDKHASFFSRQLCQGGCGADTCENGIALAQHRVILIGEPGLPVNGAVWTGSARWPMASKMNSDFVESLLARLDSSPLGQILPAHQAHRNVKAVVRVSSSTADGILIGPQQASAATGQALRMSALATGKSLLKTKQAVASWVSRRSLN